MAERKSTLKTTADKITAAATVIVGGKTIMASLGAGIDKIQGIGEAMAATTDHNVVTATEQVVKEMSQHTSHADVVSKGVNIADSEDENPVEPSILDSNEIEEYIVVHSASKQDEAISVQEELQSEAEELPIDSEELAEVGTETEVPEVQELASHESYELSEGDEPSTLSGEVPTSVPEDDLSGLAINENHVSDIDCDIDTI